MLKRIIKNFCIILALQCLCTAIVHASTGPTYKGVNLSGAEFGGCTKEAKYGFKYIYPSQQIFDFYIALGMNTFRLPFCWERLQPTANGALDSAELGRLDTAVRYATSKGVFVILDPHNYGFYRGNALGTDSTNANFADFWQKLAAHYRDNDHVIFGLMNEPHGISSENWLGAANAAITAIRQQKANNLILVPGTAWTGAHSWNSTSYGTPNGISMLNIKDPANNYAYEMHQYLDSDSSGTHADCVDETIGVRRIADATAWLKKNNKKALLGEFGGGKNATCYNAVSNMLGAIEQNADVWLGWTYWSAGAWLGNYMFALPIASTTEASQLDVVKKFLGKDIHCGATNPCSPPNPPWGLKTQPVP
ncbi:MAG TPA: glycoside hydrolase family 5 protein [Spongiibacteraceae bacterium]